MHADRAHASRLRCMHVRCITLYTKSLTLKGKGKGSHGGTGMPTDVVYALGGLARLEVSRGRAAVGGEQCCDGGLMVVVRRKQGL